MLNVQDSYTPPVDAPKHVQWAKTKENGKLFTFHELVTKEEGMHMVPDTWTRHALAKKYKVEVNRVSLVGNYINIVFIKLTLTSRSLPS